MTDDSVRVCPYCLSAIDDDGPAMCDDCYLEATAQ